MQEHDISEDSGRFGLWPSIVGFACGGLIMLLMFLLADGFA